MAIFNSYVKLPDITKHGAIEPYIPIPRCGACFRPSSPSVANSAISGRQWGFAPKKRGADGNAAAAPLCGGALEAVPRRLGTLRMWFLVKICLIFLEHLCFFCLNEFRRRYRGWYIMETIWNQGVLDDIRWSWWSISTATRLPFGHQTWLAGNPL